jgi:hypothetical protein
MASSFFHTIACTGTFLSDDASSPCHGVSTLETRRNAQWKMRDVFRSIPTETRDEFVVALEGKSLEALAVVQPKCSC